MVENGGESSRESPVVGKSLEELLSNLQAFAKAHFALLANMTVQAAVAFTFLVDSSILICILLQVTVEPFSQA